MILGKFAVHAAGYQRIGTTKRRKLARKSSRQIRVHSWLIQLAGEKAIVQR